MDAITPPFWILSLAVALGAGVVKGAVGFAVPLIMISGLSTFLEPRLALAGILLSVLATNVWQVTRYGAVAAREAVQRHWRFLTVGLVMVALTAQTVSAIPARVYYLLLGGPIVGLSLLQLSGLRLRIPPRWHRAADWVGGLISGTLGGLAGIWGPTTALYLLAIDTPKRRQMVVQGVIYSAASVVLVAAHLRSGILDRQTVWFSVALLPAALIGMAVGFRIQDRLDQDQFRRLTLLVLVLAGANLIRKGLIG
ncbi:sulfite exporter TauE/SafE family protein [Jannaschia sp. S6380]|uniref:sulfite exporter TauE/SafE family protein n=1 Tax=Jannaschia sp. S6380 TaxID=2926408 RepID=UPI001FF4032A|nr:sulfite exporter TauE/SafE family protein [Jannaschia sp. S6380]MCK0169391.1 sulfite exporter TauE/SafE family protein [Jannaschia sp. S6380]